MLFRSISSEYLRPADGLVLLGAGPGVCRGGINWNGSLYRVMGTKLVRIDPLGVVNEIGDVGPGGPVTLDYSFDLLAINSGDRLYYSNGTTLNQVVDPDLGAVIDFCWIDGYFMTTDGESLVVTELTDPYAVSPFKYASSEADPDPIIALQRLRNEVAALNRYTIEYFDNVGGESLVAALTALRPHGRIIACGGISSYNDEKPKPGPANLFNMTTQRLSMKGLIVGDWLDRQSEFEKEVGGYFRAGKLRNKETVVEGIDHAVDAFLGLFAGKNSGKMVVKLS